MSLQFQRLEAASPRGASNQTAYLRQQYMYWREQCEILTAEPVPLTEKQEAALNMLKLYIKRIGRAPSLRAFAAGLGTTVSNAHRYLVALEERGHISRLPRRERAITILETGK